MMRDPAETLRGLLEMGAKDPQLTPEESRALVDEVERLREWVKRQSAAQSMTGHLDLSTGGQEVMDVTDQGDDCQVCEEICICRELEEAGDESYDGLLREVERLRGRLRFADRLPLGWSQADDGTVRCADCTGSAVLWNDEDPLDRARGEGGE